MTENDDKAAVRELRMAADRFAAEGHPLLDRAAQKLRARADEIDTRSGSNDR